MAKQVQVRKPVSKRVPVGIDLRTPSGKPTKN